MRIPFVRFLCARPTAAVAVLALLGAVGVAARPPAAMAATAIQNSEIVAAAESYAIGSHGGQCKVWAEVVLNKVLARHGSTARVGGWGTPGGAYYGGWQRGGGHLVGQGQVQPGDVVQIVNAAHKNSDFPPGVLHSAIVVGLTSTPGTFVLRDSNWHGDELVWQHPLDPTAYARANGATAYYWRFGSATPQVHSADGLFWTTTSGVPITGDWNGDGITDIGVATGNSFSLALRTPTGARTYRKITFGAGVDRGRIPITGDWNGDGRTDVGWQHGSSFRLLVLDAAGRAHTYRVIHYGTGVGHGDVPITGDWNGDGRTEIGYVRGRTFHLALITKKAARTYRTVRYGNGASKGDLPITGDWNGDGRTDVGYVRGAAYHLAMLKHRKLGTSLVIKYGRGIGAGAVPISGDWNGDGTTDIGYRKARRFSLASSGHAALVAGKATDLFRVSYGARQYARR